MRNIAGLGSVLLSRPLYLHAKIDFWFIYFFKPHLLPHRTRFRGSLSMSDAYSRLRTSLYFVIPPSGFALSNRLHLVRNIDNWKRLPEASSRGPRQCFCSTYTCGIFWFKKFHVLHKFRSRWNFFEDLEISLSQIAEIGSETCKNVKRNRQIFFFCLRRAKENKEARKHSFY